MLYADTSCSALQPMGTGGQLLLIARRGALEALRDRMTLTMSLFFALAIPTFIALTALRTLAGQPPLKIGGELATFFLIIGLMPTTSAVGIASGQFAGEKEQGILTPLLASPASNVAIFGGKVLGSILPGLLFSAVAEAAYSLWLRLVLGPGTLGLLPAALAFAMLALVPIVALFAATIASLISSRVRSYNTAQQVGGLVLLPLWGVVVGTAVKLQDWGAWSLLALILALLAADIALVVVAASTWRREEVLAKQ